MERGGSSCLRMKPGGEEDDDDGVGRRMTRKKKGGYFGERNPRERAGKAAAKGGG